MESSADQVLEYGNKGTRRPLVSVIIWGCVLFGLCILISFVIWIGGSIALSGGFSRIDLGVLSYLHVTRVGVVKSYAVDWLNLAITLSMTVVLWLGAGLLMRRLVRGDYDDRWARRRGMGRFGSRPREHVPGVEE